MGKQLDTVYGTQQVASSVKKGYKLPRAKMTNSDLTAIINSDEIQSALRPKQTTHEFRARRKNPLQNFGFMVKLNPYAIPARRAEILRSRPGTKRAASDRRLRLARPRPRRDKPPRSDDPPSTPNSRLLSSK